MSKKYNIIEVSGENRKVKKESIEAKLELLKKRRDELLEINPGTNVEAVDEIVQAKSAELHAKKCSVEDIIKEICSIYQLKNPSTRSSSRPKAKAN